MKRKGSEGRRGRTPRTRSIETSWLCRCTYTNVPADRCYFCGARPPRRIRAEEPQVTADA